MTFGTGLWIQLLTVVTGILVARSLGAEGRGLLAGAQIWPAVLASLSLLGVNSALAIRAAKEPAALGCLTRRALLLGGKSAVVALVAGYWVVPLLVPDSAPRLIELTRVYLLYIPIFVLTSHLMALDQGRGDFGRFNATRNVLNPVYLALVLLLWANGVVDPKWFLLSLLLANLATLAFRLIVFKPERLDSGDVTERALLREGLPFWATSLAYVLRDNIERFVAVWLVGAAGLGIYVVAWTASGAHLTLSKSLNLLVFSRSASLSSEEAMSDAGRTFRIALCANISLAVLMGLLIPWLVPAFYGAEFRDAVFPAIVLLGSQGLLAQAGILDESLRGQGRPLPGMLGVVLSVAAFSSMSGVLTPSWGPVGLAVASAFAQLLFLAVMIRAVKSGLRGLRLMPNRHDLADIAGVLHGLAARLR